MAKKEYSMSEELVTEEFRIRINQDLLQDLEGRLENPQDSLDLLVLSLFGFKLDEVPDRDIKLVFESAMRLVDQYVKSIEIVEGIKIG